MTALKMRAFGQFDTREVQVVIGSEENLSAVKDVLNSFCHSHPKCNRDLRLMDCLTQNNNEYVLETRLVSKCNMTNEQARSILNRIRDCCNENYVYVYTNMFSTMNI